jgi:hypothetical protein
VPLTALARLARLARRRTSPTALGQLHDDGGAVAILVAISVSTFLLGFAALAVDFGQVYTRQNELQSVADVAALAGATALPDADDARRHAYVSVCSPANRLPDWQRPAICPVDPPTLGDTLPGWVSDGDDDNGEISLYREDDGPPQGGDGVYQPDEEIDGDGEPATAIRVLLPTVTIRFGLGRSLGADDLSVTKAATARIGTPEGAGVLPFAVVRRDLTPGASKEICVIDPEAGAVSDAYPGATDPDLRLRVTTPLFGFTFAPTLGDPLEVRRSFFFGARPLPTDEPVFLYVDGQRFTPDFADATRVRIEDLPALDSGTHDVWVQSPTEVTQIAQFTVVGGTPPAAGTTDPCPGLPKRGVLDIGRRSGELDENVTLGENLKNGIDPTPHRYDEFPVALPVPILPDLLADLRCDSPLLNAVLSLVGGIFNEDINCVTARDRGFSPGLTTGLLDDADDANPGRLLRPCSDARIDAGGRDIDDTRLFEGDQLVTNDAVDLEGLLAAGNVQRGLIRNEAFRCPRLGMVPVVDPSGTLNLDPANYPIIDFTYVWIDDGADGLEFRDVGTDLQAVRFHIIDPGFFNETVTGSLKVGPYRGEGFPKEAVLVRDVDDQP